MVIENQEQPQAHPVRKALQCKHISDTAILLFLAKNPTQWHNWCADNEFNISMAMPDNAPGRLILAKMKRLIQRQLVEGCYCGCRGDFVITQKGLDHLQNQESQ